MEDNEMHEPNELEVQQAVQTQQDHEEVIPISEDEKEHQQMLRFSMNIPSDL